ncbi:uncharacterized protein LOC135491370 [Lineus longissimus]|uniref:uncharacterized protein LOC135491370 n=1 Tax=Lineus longissimus TaxID=88925 RepID=UPI002B4C98C9
MSAEKRQLVVRQGFVDDRVAVLDIASNVYYGLDYLPVLYKTHCEDPQVMNFILEVDGKVVAYCGAEIINEGRGMLFMGARTHVDYREQGLQAFLNKEMIRQLKSLYPNLEEKLSLIWHSNRLTAEDRKQVASTISIYHFTLFNPEDVSRAECGFKNNVNLIEHINSVPFSEMKTFLEMADFRRQFPSNWICITRRCYKLDVISNFSPSYCFPERFLISKDNCGEINGVSFYNWMVDDDQNWECHEINIYCETKEAALVHFARNLQDLLENIKPKQVHTLVTYPDFIGCADFNETLNQKFGLSSKWSGGKVPSFFSLRYSQLHEPFLSRDVFH